MICTSAVIGLRILTGRLAGTYAPTGEGKFFFTMMAAFAELERDMLHERTMAGLAAARAQGRVGGRLAVMDADKIAAATARRARGKPHPNRQGSWCLPRRGLPAPASHLRLKRCRGRYRRRRAVIRAGCPLGTLLGFGRHQEITHWLLCPGGHVGSVGLGPGIGTSTTVDLHGLLVMIAVWGASLLPLRQAQGNTGAPWGW